MPRIVFDHPEINAWCQANQNLGTTSFDLCRPCFQGNTTADDLGLTDQGDYGDPIPAEAEFVKEIGAEGFIDEAEYTCQCCDVPLTSENY